MLLVVYNMIESQLIINTNINVPEKHETSRTIGFLDIETQFLFHELDPEYNNLSFGEKQQLRETLLPQLKLAIAGLLISDTDADAQLSYHYYTEENIGELFETLKTIDVIIGYNLFTFDYGVLEQYTTSAMMHLLKAKTFDLFEDLKDRTEVWIALNDLGKLNINKQKSNDTQKIPKMWRNGDRDGVTSYLKQDLDVTYELFQYGAKAGCLIYPHKKYGKFKGIRKVLIDWNLGHRR